MQKQKKVKDMQPPYQESHENLPSKQTEGQSESLTSGEIGSQASGKDEDEIQREMLRGGSSGSKADDKDVAGSVDSGETPQGREEAKNDVGGKSNKNG